MGFVVVGEKVLDQMVPAKAAGFIKRDGGGTVPGAHLQHRILLRIGLDEEGHHGLSITPTLEIRRDGDVLQLQDAVSLVGHHALGPDAAVLQHIHGPTLQIAIHHVLLLISQQKQI